MFEKVLIVGATSEYMDDIVERLNAGMAPTCNWRIKIVSN